MGDIQFSVEDRRKQGYFTVDNVLIDDYGAQLGPYGIATYTALARFANKDSECWPSHDTVAKRTGMSKRQVGREVAKLANLKLIEIVPRFDPETKEHKANLYILLEVGGIDTQSIGIDTQSTGGMDTQSRPMVSVTNRTNLKKKYTHQSNKKKERSYRPAEYAHIIRG